MFKLLRLEDRIVLDGAALDALQQKEQYDRHEFDLMQTSDHNPTPDVADQTEVSDTDDVDTHQPLFLADFTDSGDQDTGVHVLVISSDINDADDLAAAAKDDVLVIRYDAADTDADGLAKLIHNALDGKKADSIAFAVHNSEDGINLHLTQSDVTTPDSLQEAGQQAFWKSVGDDLSDNGRIDLLACNVTADQTGIQFVSDLESITGKNVAASSDLTGNAAQSGNWVLESDQIDIQKVYFDDARIEDFDSVLSGSKPVHDNRILPNASMVISYSTTFSIDAKTFVDPEGDAITYSVPGASYNGVVYYGGPLPTGVRFYPDPANPRFFGSPSSTVPVGDYTIPVNATSVDGTDSLSFNLKVGAYGQRAPVYNDLPVSSIDENAAVGTMLAPPFDPVLHVATDANGNLAANPYRIVWSSANDVGDPYGTNDSPFVIDPATGKITLQGALDYDTVSQYTLILEASDTTQLQDTARVVINVNPVSTPGLPSVSLVSFNPATFAEAGAGTATVLTAQLSGTSASPVTVNLGFGGVASLGTDYSASASVVTFAPGVTTQTVTLTGKFDTNTTEGNETVMVNIASVIGSANADPLKSSAIATLMDYDTSNLPSVSLQSNNSFMFEGGTSIITAKLDGTAPAPNDIYVYVNYPNNFGTYGAIFGTDYGASPQADYIKIPMGQGSGSITITGLTDSVPEIDETITVQFDSTKTSTAKVGTTGTVNVLLRDLTTPVVHLAGGGTIYEQGQTMVPVQVTLDRPDNLQTIAVSLNMSGNATKDADYMAYKDAAATTPADVYNSSYQVTFGMGETAKTLYFKAMEDAVVEGLVNEVATVSISAGTTYATSADTARIEIVDNDTSGLPTLNMSFLGNVATLHENTPNTTVQLAMDKAMAGDVVVTIGVTGKAGLGKDYTVGGAQSATTTSIVATIPAGSKNTYLPLTGFDDAFLDPNETFTLSINGMSNVLNAQLGTSSTLVGTVIDNDMPVVSMNFSPATFNESGGTSNLTISFTGGGSVETGDTVSLYLVADTAAGVYPAATALTDYTMGGSAVPSGSGWKVDYTTAGTLPTTVIPVGGLSDGFVEYTETIKIFGSFDGKTAGAVSATAGIIDNTPDTGLYASLAGGGSFAENGGSTTVTVNLKQAMGTPTTVYLGYSGKATLNTDFTAGATPTSVVIPVGETSAIVTLTGISDGAAPYYEGTESVVVSIQTDPLAKYSTNAVFGPAVLTANIEDQYAAPKVFLSTATTTSPEVPEGGAVLLRANLEYKTSDATVNLNYGSGNAIFGKDYTGTMQVTLTNQSYADFSINGIQDKYLESPNETFTVSIASLSGGVAAGGEPSSMIVTIIDDDATNPPQVYLDQAGFSLVTLTEGGANSTITLNLDRTVTTPTTVTLGFGGVAEGYRSDNNPDYYISVGGVSQGFTAGPAVFSTVINTGETQKIISLYARQDNVFEPSAEPLSLQITGVAGGLSSMGKIAEADTLSVYPATIQADSGIGPKVSISAPTATFMEDAGTTGLMLNVDKAAGYPITVTFTYDQSLTTPGLVQSPTYPGDFQISGISHTPPNTFNAVIPAGVTAHNLTVLGIGNTLYEGNESIKVTVTNATGGAAGPATYDAAKNAAAVTIIDDVDRPTASLVTMGAISTLYEGGASSTLTAKLTLDKPSSLTTTVTVNFGYGIAEIGNDFTVAVGTDTFSASSNVLMTLAPNVTEAQFTFGAVADSTAEGREDLGIKLSSQTGVNVSTAANELEYTIIDADFTAPAVYFTSGGSSPIELSIAENVMEGIVPTYRNVFVHLANSAPFNSTYLKGVLKIALGTDTGVGNALYSTGAGFGQNADYTVEVRDPGAAMLRTEDISDGFIDITFTDPSHTSALIKFNSVGDGVYEDNGTTETFKVKIDSHLSTNIVTAASPQTTAITMTVIDWEKTAPKLSFGITSATLSETRPADGDFPTTSPVSLLLSTATAETLTVTVQLGMTDATYDTDYYVYDTAGTPISKTLASNGMVFTIPAGVTSYPIYTISTKNDGVYEGPEAITSYFLSVTGSGKADVEYTAGSRIATAIINESDTNNKPVVSIAFDNLAGMATAAPYNFSEGGAWTASTDDGIMRLNLKLTDLTGNGYYSATPTTVMLSFNGSTGSINPAWTNTGGDYATPPGNASTALYVDYTTTNALGGLVPGFSFDTGTLTDTSDDSYRMLVTIPSGTSLAYVDFSSVNDAAFEAPEKITVNIMTATGAGVDTSTRATLYHTATLLDSDASAAPGVSLSFAAPASFSESNGQAVLKVQFTDGSKALVDTFVKVDFTSGTATYHTSASQYTSGDFTIFNNDSHAYSDARYIPIYKGATEGAIVLQGHTDAKIEANEYVTADVKAIYLGGGGFSIAGTGTTSAILVDADGPPVISIGTFAPTISEGAVGYSVGVPITMNISSDVVTTVTLSFTQGGGTATVTDDIRYDSSGTWVAGATTGIAVTIPAGASSTMLYISAVDDTYFEGPETLSVAITGYSVGTSYTQAGITSNPASWATIIDNDKLNISLSPMPSVSFGENAGQTSFSLNLYNTSGVGYTSGLFAPETVVLQFSTSGNQAMMNGNASFEDYEVSTDGTNFSKITTTDGTLKVVIPAGVQSSQYDLKLRGVDDLFFEGTETFKVSLASAGATFQTMAGGTLLTATIEDNDPATYIKLVQMPSAKISETAGGWIEAYLVGADGVTPTQAASDVYVTVNFGTDGVINPAIVGPDGTTPPLDVTYNQTQIKIAAGSTQGSSVITLTTTLYNDTVYEGPEQFSAYIPATGALYARPLDATAVQTFTILDDDPGPTVSMAISPIMTIAEAGGSATMTLYLSPNAQYSKTAAPATEFVYLDYNAAGPGLAGYGSDVTLGGDYYVEGADGKIVATEMVNGKPKMVLTIPANSSSVSYYIKAVDDNTAPGMWNHLYEGNEMINVSLGQYSDGGYLSYLQTSTTSYSGSATIIDDDNPPRTVSLLLSGDNFPENTTTSDAFTLEFNTSYFPTTVTLSFTGPATIAADGSVTDGNAALNGEDYQLQIGTEGFYGSGVQVTDGNGIVSVSGGKYTVIIPPWTVGPDALLFSFSSFDDNLWEGSESFTVKIESVVGAVANTNADIYTGTIIDNEIPIINISIDHSNSPYIDDSRVYDWRANQHFGTTAQSSPTYVLPSYSKWNGHYYMSTTGMTTGSVEPNWGTGGNVGETSGGSGTWIDMGLFDGSLSSSATVGSLYTPTLTENTYGVFFKATGTVAGTEAPAWNTSGVVGNTVTGGGLVWTNMGTYTDLTYEDDLNHPLVGTTDHTLGTPFRITKNVATTDMVTVDWELDINAINAAGFTVDYNAAALTKGTVLLATDVDSVLIDNLNITILADDKAEFNTNGTKVEDIAIKISNAKYFNGGAGAAFTDAKFAVNNGVVAGTSATQHLYVIDDDFYPGETNGQSKMGGFPIFEPMKTIGGYTLGNLSAAEVSEGGVAIIGTDDLFFQDVDQLNASNSAQDFSGLTYTVVTAPSVGTLFVDYNSNGNIDGTDTILASGSSFQQGVITSGQLKYMHGGTEIVTDTFTFTVSDGTNISYDPATYGAIGTGGDITKLPWTFGITVAGGNDKPVTDNRVFWVEENITGTDVYAEPTLTTLGYIASDGDSLHDTVGGVYNSFSLNNTMGIMASDAATAGGSFIVYDPDNYDTAGNPLFVLDTAFANGTNADQGTKLVLKVNKALDFEAMSAYTLHVVVNDSTAPGGQDAWIAVKVNNVVESDDYGPIKTIPNQTVSSGETFVYQFDKDTFPKGMEGATVVYSFVADDATVTNWLSFESEKRTFWALKNDADRPTTSKDYTITVLANYYYQNGEIKNYPLPQVKQTFTLHYSMASLDLDAVMDALQYLDGDSVDMLPADGDQIPVQDMMVARGGDAPDANAEVSEVLALLDAEAYLYESQQA